MFRTMANQPSDSSFPESQRDISQLKQTATDAVSDLGKSAAPHAEKAKEQLKNLANDAKNEGSAQLDNAKAQFRDVLDSAREYAVARPIACIGVALLIGLLLGRSRRCSRA